MFKFGSLLSLQCRGIAMLFFVCSLLTSPGPAAAAAATHHCWCQVTCTSSQNGQSFQPNPSGVSVGAPYAWPISPAKHDDCSNRCLGHLQDNAVAIADTGKLCKTGVCKGKSWIGTGTGGPRWTVSNVDFDNSGKPYCTAGGGEGACCPEFTKAITPGNLASLFVEGAHPSGQPYTMTFNSNGAFSNALESYLKEWAHWLSVDGCKGVAGFSIKYDLYNTGSPTKPTSPNPVGSLVASQTVAYIGMAVTPSSFVWNLPASPNWWFVKATVTPIGSSGRPVECAKTSGCMDRLYTGWIDDALTAFRSASGAQQAGTLRYLD